MWKNLAFLLLPLSLLAVNAKALLISDTYVLEQQLESGVGLGHIFEMIPLGYHRINVDLFGNINFWIIPYTNNLWLHSVTAEIEVDRKIDVPQPNSILMLSIGLLALLTKQPADAVTAA